jgi:SAM-dependent methyltransferase
MPSSLSTVEPGSVGFGYNTILKLEQFSDPAFADLLRETFPSWAESYPGFPKHYETAKTWEVTQCIRAFRDFGILRPDAELLGIGAGYEMTLYYLTNHVRRVFATDLYATNIDWKEAQNGMLVDPADFAPGGYDWHPRRLVVQHMNALDLRYDDDSFDGVFSCGSIEHFGSLENVAQAAREAGRVLKPGGIFALATEFRIDGNAEEVGIPGAILFTPEYIEEHIVKASGLIPVDEMRAVTTQETTDCAYPIVEAIEKGIRQRSIAATHNGFTWTSGFICLRKPSYG